MRRARPTAIGTVPQRKDPKNYPEITYLGRLFRSVSGSILIGSLGQARLCATLYGAEEKNDYLDEDVHNVGLMLNRFYFLGRQYQTRFAEVP